MREIRWSAIDSTMGASDKQCRVSSNDRTQKAFPGVGFSRFVTGLVSRVIVGPTLSERRLAPAPQARRR